MVGEGALCASLPFAYSRGAATLGASDVKRISSLKLLLPPTKPAQIFSRAASNARVTGTAWGEMILPQNMCVNPCTNHLLVQTPTENQRQEIIANEEHSHTISCSNC